MGLFNQYLGRHISDTVGSFGDILGDDTTSIVDVVKTTLTGTQEEIISLVNAQEVDAQQAGVAAETVNGLAGEPNTVPLE